MQTKNSESLAGQAEKILNISFTQVGNRLAYYATETSEWYWITVADLREAIALSKSEDPDILRDIYSHWCSSTGKVMSARSAAKLTKTLW